MAKKSLKLMGKKRGMLHIFDDKGHLVPCTVLEVEPNIVTAVMSEEKNKYSAVQLGYEKCSERKISKPLRGHYSKNQIETRRHLSESRIDDESEYNIGDEIGVGYFAEAKHVDVSATSKGKGYQGVMKKYNFRGGRATHGCSRYHRGIGSTGMRSTPGRCFPGGKRASQMGNEKKTVQSLTVMQVIEDDNLILVKGAVPGPNNGRVTISHAIKK